MCLTLNKLQRLWQMLRTSLAAQKRVKYFRTGRYGRAQECNMCLKKGGECHSKESRSLWSALYQIRIFWGWSSWWTRIWRGQGKEEKWLKTLKENITCKILIFSISRSLHYYIYKFNEMHLSQFVFYYYYYYYYYVLLFLHVSTHLSHHQGESRTRENMHENTSVYPHYNV
jgi:hypothetical protein